MNTKHATSPVWTPEADFPTLELLAFTRIIPLADMPTAEPNAFWTDREEFDSTGEPRRYFVESVDAENVTLHLLGMLPCAVEWCAGHAWNEADSWAELTHQGRDVDLPFTGGDRRSNYLSINRTQSDGKNGLSVNVEFEGTLARRADLAQLVSELRRAADEVERFADWL